MSKLSLLHSEIDGRVTLIRQDRPDWQCSKGCDHCCRGLADVPRLTAAEWALLEQGLSLLPAQRLAEIGRDMAAMAAQASRPLTCPMLDLASAACPVYAQRPVACRTYGFYVQRDKGLYCADLEAQVAAGVLDDVVWGNHDGIDRQLGSLGETRPLTQWFAQWYPVA